MTEERLLEITKLVFETARPGMTFKDGKLYEDWVKLVRRFVQRLDAGETPDSLRITTSDRLTDSHIAIPIIVSEYLLTPKEKTK